MAKPNKTNSFLAATLNEIKSSGDDVKDNIIAGLKRQLADASQINISDVGVDLIDPSPYQCRTYYGIEEIEELTASIREFGLITPLIVRIVSGRYELIAGHMRHISLRALGILTAPVRVLFDISDEQAAKLVLIENLKRTNINPIEEVRSVLALLLRMDLSGYNSIDTIITSLKKIRPVASGKTNKSLSSDQIALRDIAKELVEVTTKNKWESFLVNRLPLLDMPTFLQEMVIKGLEYTKAKLLWKIFKSLGEERGKEIAVLAVNEKLSMSEIKKFLPEKISKEKESQPEVDSSTQKYSNNYQLISAQLKDIDCFWDESIDLSREEAKSLKILMDSLSSKINLIVDDDTSA